MENAIKKAISQGYGFRSWTWRQGDKGRQTKFKIAEAILLDPDFWKCLGKALGWEGMRGVYTDGNRKKTEEWLYHWHRFIDHIAEGKKPDEFFNELLK